MKPEDLPIFEYDPAPTAILNPDMIEMTDPVPTHAVICFFQDIIDDLINEEKLSHITTIRSEMGKHHLYLYHREGKDILVFQPGIGAPLGCAMLEEVIALGGRYFIVCGGAGVLHDHIAVNHPFILTSAVRDEGTSYHYLPPSREVSAHPQAVAALENAVRALNLDYSLTKAWTTDAIYRETVQRRETRVNEGCDVVEMEAAAFFAVARFRNVVLGQIVYAGDLVKPDGWDGRSWNSRKSTRRLLFEIAVDAVSQLS